MLQFMEVTSGASSAGRRRMTVMKTTPATDAMPSGTPA